MLSQTEKSILKKISEAGLITKPELNRFLQTNGNSGKDMMGAIESITRKLMEQRFVSSIAPVGSTCYIITQKGAQYLKEQEI